MGRLLVDCLETGMVLQRDVHDRNGRLLLGTGTELSGKHLMILRAWGVEEVHIEGIEDGDCSGNLPAELSTEAIAEATRSLEPLFMHAGTDHPFIRELLRLAVIRKAANEL